VSHELCTPLPPPILGFRRLEYALKSVFLKGPNPLASLIMLQGETSSDNGIGLRRQEDLIRVYLQTVIAGNSLGQPLFRLQHSRPDLAMARRLVDMLGSHIF